MTDKNVQPEFSADGRRLHFISDGEEHGFRKNETIAHFYGEVDAFLRRHVVFAPGQGPGTTDGAS